jgi:hypothetical protein
MTSPVAWVLLEDGIHDWIAAVDGLSGETVTFPEREESGSWEPEPPAAQIRLLSGPIPLSQPEIRKVPSIVVQRITVVSAGAGAVGVSVYVGYEETATVINYAAGAGDTIASSRAGLLVLLTANLPAGITAALDPSVAAGILITGSSSVPLFGCRPSSVKTTVTPLVERFPELEARWSRITWRVEFRGSGTQGFGTAADLMARAKSLQSRVGNPLLHAAGWRYSGTLASTPLIPTDRNESRASYDFAVEGYATAAFQDPALRRVRTTVTAA